MFTPYGPDMDATMQSGGKNQLALLKNNFTKKQTNNVFGGLKTQTMSVDERMAPPSMQNYASNLSKLTNSQGQRNIFGPYPPRKAQFSNQGQNDTNETRDSPPP